MFEILSLVMLDAIKCCDAMCRLVMRQQSSCKSPRRLVRHSGLQHRSSIRRQLLPTRRLPRRPGTWLRKQEMRSANLSPLVSFVRAVCSRLQLNSARHCAECGLQLFHVANKAFSISVT